MHSTIMRLDVVPALRLHLMVFNRSTKSADSRPCQLDSFVVLADAAKKKANFVLRVISGGDPHAMTAWPGIVAFPA